MRPERFLFSTTNLCIAFAFSAVLTFAPVNSASAAGSAPAVYLLSDASAPKASRDAANDGIKSLKIPMVKAESLGAKFKQTEANLAKFVAKLVDAEDGADPVFVVVTNSRGIGASFVRTPQGARVLSVSLGTLAAVDDDSQLAMVIGHELKHGSSQIEEMLDQKKYYRRKTLLDGLAESGSQKSIENEVDVKALIDKVHKKGYSTASAIRFFDKIEAQYGDAYNVSHPMIVQRKGMLNAASTGLTRGKGEELREAPVNDVVDKDWKAFFKSKEYRVAASKEVQAALRSQSFESAEKALTAIKNGSPDFAKLRGSDNIIRDEVFRRWDLMRSAVVDRPLAENLKLGEAMKHQVIKDYLTLKEKILGTAFEPRSISEAAYLLKLSEGNPWNPAMPMGGGRIGDFEESLQFSYRDSGYQRTEIQELKASPDATSAAVAEQIAEKEAEIARNDAMVKILSKHYKLSKKEVEASLDRILLYDHDYSFPRYMEDEEKAALRGYRKMNVKLGPQIEADQNRAIRDFTKHIGDITELDSQVRQEIYRTDGMLRGPSVNFRKMMFRDLPAALLKKAETASPEARTTIARQLQYQWLEEFHKLTSKEQTLEVFGTPEGSKQLKQAIDLINEVNLEAGNQPFEFAVNKNRPGIYVHSNKIFVPADKLALFVDSSEGPLKSAEKNLLSLVKNAKEPQDIATAFENFVNGNRDAVLEQKGSAWLDRIRDAMGERYKQLLPAYKEPRELAEAVIDLKMSWGGWPTYKIGSREMLRRLEAVAAIATPRDPGSFRNEFGIAPYSDLFRYRIWQMRRGDTADREFFSLLGKSREILTEYSDIVEDPIEYDRHVKLRRDFALWAAEHEPKSMSVAIGVSNGVHKGWGDEVVRPTALDRSKLYADVTSKFKKNGRVDWPTFFKYYPDTSMINSDYWRQLSQGSGDVWVQEVLGIQNALRDKKPDQALSRKNKIGHTLYANDQRAGFIDIDFMQEAAPSATPEELQQLLKHAFSRERPWAARDQLFEKFWKATEKRPDLRAAFADEKFVSKLMFKENGLLLAKYQIAKRFPDTGRGLSAREPGVASGEVEKIKAAIERQFPEPSFTRNQLLDWTEKSITSTSAEHRVLKPLWVNQDNWAEMKGLALSDALDGISSALETNSDRIAVVEYMTGRTKTFPSEILDSRKFHRLDDREKEKIKSVLPLLPSRFEALDRYERAFALHPFLVGEKGVLASTEGARKVQEMVLGTNANDVRFQAFFESYLESVPAHEKSTLMSYLLGQTGQATDNQGRAIREILEAMPPLGIRAGQEIRSSGRAGAAINKELDQLRDHAMPPSRKQIHEDVSKAFVGNEKNVRIGKLRGSGSVNYVVDIDVFDPVKKVWQPRVLKVQRDNVGGHVVAEDRNWQKALAKLKDHPDREVRVSASVIDDARGQAVSRLRPGGVELNAKAEAALHPAAAASYDSATTRAVQPDQNAASLIPESQREKFGVYERIEGVPLNEVKDAAERKRFATTMLDQELAAIFKKGQFDTDPQMGNWLRENKTGKFVRLDYAQLTTVDGAELEEFRKMLVMMLDPKTGAKDSKAVAKLWSSIMKNSGATTGAAMDVSLIEFELGKIMASGAYTKAIGPWERITVLRHDLNERLVKAGKPAQEFREGSRAAWTSLKKLSGIRGEYLTDKEFFKVFNRHVKVPITTQIRLARGAGMTVKEIASDALSNMKTALKRCPEAFAIFGSKVPAQ